MLPFPLYLALKYLRPKRAFISLVTSISVAGVMLGVAILVIVLAVMTGFDNMWREKILSFKPHLTVTALYGVIEDEHEIYRKLDDLPGITAVAAGIELRTLAEAHERISAPVVLGIDPQRAAAISRVPEFIVAGEFDINGENCVVGIDLAAQMGLTIGSELLVYSPRNVMTRDEMHLPEALTVRGIYDLGMRDFDGGFVITSLAIGQDLAGMDRGGAFSVHIMTDDPFRFSESAGNVRSAIGPGYDVQTWREIDSLLFQALSHEKLLMACLLGIITVVAVFCVTNTLIVITYQKTHEIGLLKALGFSSWRIMSAFMLHGWIQCLVGNLLGILLGVTVLMNLDRLAGFLAGMDIEAFPKDIYGLSRIPWEISVSDVTIVSVFVMVFCTLVSLVPAGRAVWLDPVEALRSE